MRRISDEWKKPIVVFTDCDPWSFRIFASIAYGAIKTAHISEYLATKEATYLGITADDILAYDLPSDDLSKQDINALEAELSDPRFNTGWWQEQIKLMQELGKRQAVVSGFNMNVTSLPIPIFLRNLMESDLDTDD